MKISEILSILKMELILGRTPIGRPLTDYAVETIEAVLSDEKNYDSEAIKCKNCCIIISSLLVPEGCMNCGSKDLITDIKESDIQ